MDTISLNICLRPVRFGFIVRPDDKTRLQRIFQINTCLWGGKFNPIIPFFKRVPKWWERNGLRFDNAKQIVNGYLDFFEPDFVVEAEKGIADGLGFKPERVLQLSDILVRNGDREKRGYGLNVLDLYRGLYKEEYQFVRRHKQTFISVKAIDPAFSNFAACVFGAFPEQKTLNYFKTAFKDAFDPEEINLNATSFKKLFKSGGISALRIGHSELEVDYHNQREPVLFILNAHEPRDLVDYWNYRAIHPEVIAIPAQWIAELSDVCKTLIVKNHRPLPGNPNGVMISAKVMFSRSISDQDIEQLAEHFRVDKPGANLFQAWYPPIWRSSPEFVVRTIRPTVECDSKKIDVPLTIEKPDIQFDTLYPSFAERFGNDYRWANVIRLKDWNRKDGIATIFPCDFRNPVVPKFELGEEHLLSTTEGLVIFPKFKNIPEFWRLIDGTEALNQWLKNRKITCRFSDSGRATQQIIQTLGGFWGVGKIANKGIIDLLEEMSRTPITRSAHRHEFENKIKSAIGKNIWQNRVFETLVERKVVELGYELKCSKCGSWSWYSLSQLDASIRCDLCLRTFNFPITDPNNSAHARWAYRVIGPFALPDYSRGGYASALAIRFFSDVVGRGDHAETTWSAGQELTFQNGSKVEADYILWYQRKNFFGTDYPTEIVFGEAKSFGKDAFEEKDIVRMKSFAEAFPSAILVFATMKDASQLSKDEIRRIRKLAEWGREYDKDRQQSRAPVIVLTGTELFAAYNLEHAWKEKGGKHKQLISSGCVRADNLRTLADLTQCLYLDMPSYGEWREKKWKKRKQQRVQA